PLAARWAHGRRRCARRGTRAHESGLPTRVAWRLASHARLRAAVALPLVWCARHAVPGPVRRLRRGHATQYILLRALRPAAAGSRRLLRILPAASAGMGCRVGAVPLRLAAGPAGDPLQIRRRPGRRPGPGHALAT